MRIANKDNVRVIKFKHIGTDLSYRCEYRNEPVAISYEEIMRTRPSSEVEFEFNDSAEIELLIRMLQMFKRECEDEIGCWK